jgi:UDP-N-acetylglucosamine/UDP-N-acetylgalactosamine diphosphorylase
MPPLPLEKLESAVGAAVAAAGQAHLLQPPPAVGSAEREALLRQIHALDLPGLRATFDRSLSRTEGKVSIEPFDDVTDLAGLPAAEVSALRGTGLRNIAAGRTATLLLAGGQGTRLGSSAPKGCYDIGMPSGKSLFQYHAERVLAVKRLAAAHAGVAEGAVRLPLLVMTSEATGEATRAFFAARSFFGLKEEEVIFFNQARAPPHSAPGLAAPAAPPLRLPPPLF